MARTAELKTIDGEVWAKILPCSPTKKQKEILDSGKLPEPETLHLLYESELKAIKGEAIIQVLREIQHKIESIAREIQ